MTTTLPSLTEGARRRIVLIDFDWQDADHLPVLLQKPGIVVRLVAGERTEDAGLRMAEMCGLPRTLDLADLTREIFDVALVSDRSPRRARVQSLLEALRTPCLSPREFLEDDKAEAGDAPAPKAAANGPEGVPPGPVPGESRPAGPAARKPKPAAPTPPDAAPEAPAAVAPADHVPAAADSAAPSLPAPVVEEPIPAPAPSLVAVTAASAPVAPPAAPAAAPPSVLDSTSAHGEAPAGGGGGEDFEAVVDRALEVMARAASDARSRPREAGSGIPLQSLSHFPSPEDRAALEAALRQLMAHTGAVGAELHAGRASLMELVAQVGTHDPLLEGMVGLALQLNTPQVIKGLSSPHEGRLWGAWPFRTIQHRGVLAASAIDPQGGVSPWEKMVDEMRERWDRQDREGAVRSFPLLPGQERAWLERPEFRGRLELAVERNKFDGLQFSLHRLEFPGPQVTVERLCEGLPQLLRGTDSLCHLPPRGVLLLTAVPPESYTHVRRRLLAAWEQAWRECGQSPPAPPITDLRAEMAGPEDAEEFLESADGWLSGPGGR